jgi:hypothetical protein
MLRRALSILLVCLSACGQSGEITPSRDLEIVKAALASTCDARGFARVVVTDKPARYRNYALPDDWDQAAEYIAAFERQPAAVAPWPLGEICPNAGVVAQEAIDAEFANDPRVPPGWERFHAIFQAMGFRAYSRPAYSLDGQRAAVLVDTYCGVMCGMGLVIELEQTKHGWIVVRAAGTWIS